MVFFCLKSTIYAQTNVPSLVLLTDSELIVEYTELACIQVQYLGIDGPISGVIVSFTPQSDTADTTLRNSQITTDGYGIAETYISAGEQSIDFDVKISVPDDDTVTPLTVHVRVTNSVCEIMWPSEEFPSIQDAINALASGGTLTIAEGTFKIDEPIFIRSKEIIIEGAGSGRKSKEPKKRNHDRN